VALGHGGARPGPRPPRAAVGGDTLNAERNATRADFEAERARHEKIKADEREFEFEIRKGEYLPRDAQRSAAATALAVLTQSLRSIPDNLERSLGLAPEAVESISVQIDDALAEIAAAFRAMTNDG
jgi:hypothetical protein